MIAILAHILHILLALPEGSQVLSVTQSGTSLWVDTVKIHVRLQNGELQDFFKKVRPLLRIGTCRHLQEPLIRIASILLRVC